MIAWRWTPISNYTEHNYSLFTAREGQHESKIIEIGALIFQLDVNLSRLISFTVN